MEDYSDAPTGAVEGDDVQNTIAVSNDSTGFPVVAIAIALVAVGLTFALAFYLRSRSSARSAVLLVGLQGSGKSSLFTKLQFGHVFETHSSLKTNTAVIKTGTQEKGFVLYDIPGQYRLRSLAVDQLAATAKAVVFVVDSHTCRAAIADVSAWLYTVVAHNIISSGRVPIVLACNKQDMFGAPSPTAIAASLLAEMNKIRTTRMSDTTLGGNEVFLGHSNKPLAWADLPNTIVVMGCSIHDSDGLLEYISSLE